MTVTGRSIRIAALGLLAAGLGGCGIVGDFFAPTLAASLGLDPSTINPSQGTVIVAFHNMTQSPATFLAFKATNASDFTTGSRNFSVQVQPGQVGNEVLDCPVGLITPGTFVVTGTTDTGTGTGTGTGGTNTGTGTTTGLNPGGGSPTVTGSFDFTAAVLTAAGTAGAATTTNGLYQGQPLVSGAAFACGDVIEIRLISAAATTQQAGGQTGTGGQAQTQYAIAVRVIPGG